VPNRANCAKFCPDFSFIGIFSYFTTIFFLGNIGTIGTIWSFVILFFFARKERNKKENAKEMYITIGKLKNENMENSSRQG
jgi:hypothetical protein